MIRLETKIIVTCSTPYEEISFSVNALPEYIKAHFAYAHYMVEAGYKIEAIKLIRSVFGCGLKEAKTFVESAKNDYNGGSFLGL